MKIYKSINILTLCAVLVMLISCVDDEALNDVGAKTFTDIEVEGGFVSISSSATSVVEGGTVDFTVTVPNPVHSDVDVSFSFGGNATLGTDYTVTSDDVTVSNNAGSGTVEFNITGGGADNITFTLVFPFDAQADADSVTVTLTQATAANGTPMELGDPTSNPGGDPVTSLTVNISDPDLKVSLESIANVAELLEKDTVSVPIALDADLPGGSIDVTYSIITTAANSATSGADFNLISSNTITMTGSASTINIEILPDLLSEEDEKILVVLSSLTNTAGLTASISDADSVEFSIVDNKSVVSFDAESDLTLSEPAAAVATTSLVGISLSEPADADVQVSYSFTTVVAGITSPNGGSVTIPKGKTSANIVVSIDPDVFDGDVDIKTSLKFDSVTSASEEVSLSTDAAAIESDILIDNTLE